MHGARSGEGKKMTKKTLECVCGAVTLEVSGEHIVSVECYCDSCRKAGAELQALPGAPPLLESNGATRCVLHRKDRVRCTRGEDRLREHRLAPSATTRRVVATCCNTAMFMEFLRGHWLSLYGRRFRAEALPPLEMRTMTRDLKGTLRLPDDVPNSKTQSVSFMTRLLGAWVAMRLRTPTITFVNGALDARG